MLSSRRRLVTRVGGKAERAGDGEQKSECTEKAESHGCYLGGKKLKAELAAPDARFLDRDRGVEIEDPFANSSRHFAAGYAGRIGMGTNYERG